MSERRCDCDCDCCAALEAEVERLRKYEALANDHYWVLKTMLTACPVREGGDAHRRAEEAIARHDELKAKETT